MSYWILIVAPLVLASFVMLFAFVGCGLDSGGLGGPTTYEGSVNANNNLVGYWRLGEREGKTAADSSPGNHDGEYVGGVALGQPGLLAGNSDTAVQFDGSSAYVKVPHDTSFNPAKFTLEAIVTVTGGTEFRAILSSRDIAGEDRRGFILYAGSDDNWQAWVGDGATWQIATGTPITPEKHYLAVTYNGETLTLYVDPVDDTPAAPPLKTAYEPNTARELRIGAGGNEVDPPDFFFTGVIDEVAIYNVDLPFEALKYHFDLATNGPDPGPDGD